MCKLIICDAEKIEFTPNELMIFVREVVKTTILEHKPEYMSRGEAIELLGCRKKLEDAIAEGLINPIRGDRNQKWRVLTSEVLMVKRLKEKKSDEREKR